MKMLMVNATLGAMLLTACSGAEERRHTVWMNQIEQLVRMPEGSRPLNEYARYYASDEQGRVVGIYTVFVEPDAEAMNLPAGKRRWVGLTRNLPAISDGGCAVVTVRFDPKGGKIEQAFCNGVA